MLADRKHGVGTGQELAAFCDGIWKNAKDRRRVKLYDFTTPLTERPRGARCEYLKDIDEAPGNS